jgi:hypothetical protein
MQHLSEPTKHTIDALSIVTVIGTIATWLPPAAALVSLIWGVGRLIEMWTGKTIAQLRKERREGKSIERS